MKEKLLNFTFATFTLISFIFIFCHNKEIANVIIDATDLFLKRVFVSLFPMFILNDLLISLNIPYYFYKIFNKSFLVLFKTSGISAYVFIMSLISGTPSQAIILSELVSLDKISVDEASHYLYFTYFSNPLFLFTMNSLIFEANIVLKIIFIHYFSNIIIAILVRHKAPIITNSVLCTNHTSFSKTIILSIKKSMNTLLMILGTIVFYMLISYILTNLLPTNNITNVFLKGLLELTSGLSTLSNINLIPKIKEIIAIAIISFGGLSIHTQIRGILEETPIAYKNFFIGRILQTIISVILIIIF